MDTKRRTSAVAGHGTGEVPTPVVPTLARVFFEQTRRIKTMLNVHPRQRWQKRMLAKREAADDRGYVMTDRRAWGNTTAETPQLPPPRKRFWAQENEDE